MFRHLIGLCFALVFFQSCQTGSSPANNTPKTLISPQESHVRMIALLDSIARNARPEDCYNLNSKMAEQLQAQLTSISDPTQRVIAQFRIAQEMLHAGKNEAALVQLLELAQVLGNTITEGNKPIFDYLALAYLRIGEQQNCISTHTAQSCILPIQGDGVYRMQAGPENAVKVYEKILQVFPNDLDSRWLLNIAYMNLGKYPQGVPKQYLIPTSVFQKKGNLRFKDIAIPLGLDVRGLSGGVCMEDFDNDGDLDLFVTSYGLSDPCRYFSNNGNGTFSERTHEAHLDGVVSGLNTIHADYDNDGLRDIFILRGGWLEGGTHPNSLLHNNGDGTFTDVTIRAGLLSFCPTQAGAWADFDGDGLLDLYVANESRRGKTAYPNELYHNNGDGTFANVAEKTGLNQVGFYKAAVWGDVNNDHRPDLYLSNLSGENKLYLNRCGASAGEWKFEDISVKAGVTNPMLSFPAWFFDFDNDGYEDILVCGYIMPSDDQAIPAYIAECLGTPSPDDHLRLYRNNHNATFSDVHQEMGLHKVNFAMGCNFGDLDNDGWIDFYLGTGTPDLRGLMPNRMFRNAEGSHFEEITMNGFGHLQKGHGVAFGDIDNDGDQDIYEVIGGAYEGDQGNNVLFENPGNNNHWINFLLEGKTCNRDAIGAKIAVYTHNKSGETRSIFASVNTGASFGASSLRQEIGLGQAAAIDSVVVWWPKNGLPKAVYKNLALDENYRLKEGSTQPESCNLAKWR